MAITKTRLRELLSTAQARIIVLQSLVEMNKPMRDDDRTDVGEAANDLVNAINRVLLREGLAKKRGPTAREILGGTKNDVM